MKTKVFLMICLLSGMGLIPLSAQNGTADHTYVTKSCGDYWCPITCDGVNWDYLTGSACYTFLINGWKGGPRWVKQDAYKITATNSLGETFHGQETDKGVAINFDPVTGNWESSWIWYAVLIGDRGTHIKITLSGLWLQSGVTWSLIEAKCF